MLWYEGNIAEAIQKSRQEGAVFGVAIFGNDDTSKNLESSLADGAAQEAIKRGRFVFIRISADSEEHRQFSQIFNNAPAGSIYLIGNAGAVLELMNSPTTPSDLKTVLDSAWTKHSGTGSAQPVQQQKPSTTSTSSTSEPSTRRGESSNTAQALANANEAVRVAEVAASQSDLTLEQKIERAQQLAAAKRQQKLAQEAEEERQRERERREMGKGMAELKRWQEEEEAKRLVEQRKKEKLEEQELRKRVKEQIAQDRAARNARTNVSFLNDGPVSSEQSGRQRPVGVEATNSARDYSGQARLQFRMPTGSSISHGFDPDATTLAHARDFLVTNNHVTYRQFNLSVAYPRREFTTLEYSSTLRDLGLVPSATLLVLPIGSSSSISRLGSGSSVGSWLSILVGYLFIPFTFIFSLFQRALPASGTTPESSAERSSRSSASVAAARARTSGQTSSDAPRSSSSATSSANPRGDSSSNAEVRNRKGNKGENSSKSAGNIHRLRTNEGDSEDDQGTWNGNSTQQM